MLDIKLIRENPELVKANLRKRGMDMKVVDEAVRLHAEHNRLLQEVEQLRRQRNEKSGEVAKLKKAGADISLFTAEVKKINGEIAIKESRMAQLAEGLEAVLYSLPNILHESVPVGATEEDSAVVRVWGEPRKFSFPVKGHEELALQHNLLDIERAGKISGARFAFLKNELVILDLALQRFALDHLRSKGFQLVEPPHMIHKKPFSGVTDAAAFEETIYKIEGDDLYLIATAEHPLGSMFTGEVLDERQLPLRLAGLSPCYRREAGAHGKDTKGIFRTHQFTKIEQFVFCTPEQSWTEFEQLQKNAEELYKKLGLPYRVVNICTGDIGTIAAKKYDIEVWMPSQARFREVTSCSHCTDYQARRLKIRYGIEGEKPRGLVHTLNNTAIATGRTMVAILENFQQADGSIKIPKVLVPYTGFSVIPSAKESRKMQV